MTYTPALPAYEHQLRGVAKRRSVLDRGTTGFAYLAEMGCVDGDTEYLSPSGWSRIADYVNGPVAQFHLDGRASFVQPSAYLRRPVDAFLAFRSEVCDQVLSLDHRMLLADDGAGGGGDGVWRITSPRSVRAGYAFRWIRPHYFPALPDVGPDLPSTELRVDWTLLPRAEPTLLGDGLMYCFTVPTGFLVLRRGGRAFASGNTGKSFMLQLDWGELYDAGEIDDMLLVAPAGVYRNWEGEFKTHLDPEVYERANIFTWRAGGGVGFNDRLRTFLAARDRRRPRFFLVNAESFQSDTGLVAAVDDFLDRTRYRAMTAVDESTLMKNHQAARTKRIVNLKYASAQRRILSGLPNPKSPLDLYSQFEFLDRRILGHENFFSYRAKYAVIKRIETRGPGGVLVLNKDGTPKKRPEVTGYRNLEELKARVATASFRVLKEECLDLPPKVYMPLRTVLMHPEQRRIYADVRDNATAELADGSFVTAQQVITQLLRLQQILCGHVVDESGRVHEVPEHRTDALMEDLDAVGGKAIVWTIYRHSIEKIAARIRRDYGERAVVTYYGQTSSDDRVEAVERFQNDRETLFFLGNQQTAGRGITLTAAVAEIYHSNSPDLELRLQSEDRAHRAGLDHSVAYSDLCVPGSVDERWIRTLRNKIDLSTAVLGDGPRAWLI